MPLYDFSCQCGSRFERFVALANFSDPQHCTCGLPARRVISAPMFSVDATDYTCPITGDYVGSKHQHRENLAKHGCRVFETGEREAAEQRRRAEDARLDKAIEDSVEREFEALPSDKKEQLHNELVNAKVDIAVERQSV